MKKAGNGLYMDFQTPVRLLNVLQFMQCTRQEKE